MDAPQCTKGPGLESYRNVDPAYYTDEAPADPSVANYQGSDYGDENGSSRGEEVVINVADNELPAAFR